MDKKTKTKPQEALEEEKPLQVEENKIFKGKLKFVLIFFLFLTVFPFYLDSVNPDFSLMYKVKRVEESALKKTLYNNNPQGYYTLILGRRLKELIQLSEVPNSPNMQSSASRYATTIAEVINFDKLHDPSELEILKKNLKAQQQIIKTAHDKMYMRFGVMETLNQRRYMQGAMDSVDIYTKNL